MRKPSDVGYLLSGVVGKKHQLHGYVHTSSRTSQLLKYRKLRHQQLKKTAKYSVLKTTWKKSRLHSFVVIIINIFDYYSEAFKNWQLFWNTILTPTFEDQQIRRFWQLNFPLEKIPSTYVKYGPNQNTFLNAIYNFWEYIFLKFTCV